MNTDHRRDDLTGDRAVDAAWHRASVDEPAARTDEAILEAARAATRSAGQARPVSRPARRPWTYWRPVAAAATVAALAFLLVPRTEHLERSRTTPTQRPVTQTTAPAAEAAPAAKPEPTAQRAAAPPTESQSASVPVSAEATRDAQSPEQWTRRIESLYAAGDEAGAAAALREFRRAYPDADAQLAPALRAWAAQVPQEP